MVTVAVVLIFKQDGGEFARKKCWKQKHENEQTNTSVLEEKVRSLHEEGYWKRPNAAKALLALISR